ncbi:hypothetical protein G7Y89_g8871 [Cudoniella acicularis]|uniref:BTB domain-containing protein n=1 Tax=Cudoniella acicularis TaxID=354080 RepID=A0A8H4W0N0_9HELO|nr:hypothetical protein G7Y89_g8871 [Cudoniella acicularis]
MEAEFKSLSKIAIYQSTCDIRKDLHEDLPISSAVCDAIEQRRTGLISVGLTALKTYVAMYQGPIQVCLSSEAGRPYACDATALGSLLKSLEATKLWPHPQVPYPGLSLEILLYQIDGLKVISLCDYYNSNNHNIIFYGSSLSSTLHNSNSVSIERSLILLTNQLGLHQNIWRIKMGVEHVTVDPDGDLTLILTYPVEPKENEKTEDAVKGISTAGVAATSTVPSAVSESPAMYADGFEAKEPIPARKAHFLVSSNAMTVASPVFKAMLRQNSFKEGHDLSLGSAKVELPDDDPSAFTIVANILHHRNRQVPKKVDLQTISAISLLVDKYQLLEAMELYLDLWLPELKKTLPTTFTENLFQWLSIAWVFRLSEEFSHLTKIAEWESDRNLSVETVLDLPIPRAVIGSASFRYNI